MAMTDLQQDPWKLRLVKYYLDIYVLCLFKLFILIYICGFSVKVTCAFRVYEKQWRNSQNKHVFRVKKNNVIFHSFDQIKFQEYRCKSGIVFFAWMVT